MTRVIICPVCHQADQVEKVSTIYLTGIEAGRHPSGASSQAGGRDSSTRPTGLKASLASGRHALSRRLAPPSSGKELPIRPLHPDTVVLTFSLVVPIFLFGILTSQPRMLLPMLVMLAVFYGLYWWQRKTVIAKFELQRTTRQASNEHVKRGLDRWMKLYHCSRDDVVFEPGKSQFVPTDQMTGYLFRE